MSGSPADERRDAILRRVTSHAARSPQHKAGAPLDWDDIGYLSHGLIFGNRPMLRATEAVTERYALGPRGGWMLNLISGGLVHPHELSNVLRIGRSLVSAELARLVEAGLVESRTGHPDRRRSELVLTETGLAALAEIRRDLFRILSEALVGYTPDEIRAFAAMLNKLDASVGSAGASPG